MVRQADGGDRPLSVSIIGHVARGWRPA